MSTSNTKVVNGVEVTDNESESESNNNNIDILDPKSSEPKDDNKGLTEARRAQRAMNRKKLLGSGPEGIPLEGGKPEEDDPEKAEIMEVVEDNDAAEVAFMDLKQETENIQEALQKKINVSKVGEQARAISQILLSGQVVDNPKLSQAIEDSVEASLQLAKGFTLGQKAAIMGARTVAMVGQVALLAVTVAVEGAFLAAKSIMYVIIRLATGDEKKVSSVFKDPYGNVISVENGILSYNVMFASAIEKGMSKMEDVLKTKQQKEWLKKEVEGIRAMQKMGVLGGGGMQLSNEMIAGYRAFLLTSAKEMRKEAEKSQGKGPKKGVVKVTPISN